MDSEQQNDQAIVEQIINDSIGWALTKNKARLFDIMAHDDDFLSSIPIPKARSSGSRRSSN